MAWLQHELTRLFSPDFVEDLPARPMEELRQMRAECQSAETALSYLRRIAQGRLDIVECYLERQDDTEREKDLASIVEELPAIIASGPPRPSGPGRLPSLMSPDMEIGDLTSELDGVLDAELIGELPRMPEDELRSIASSLMSIEARLSDERHSIHERIDKLQAEIVSRYKTGQASVEELLK